MATRRKWAVMVTVVGMLLPQWVWARGVASEMNSLHSVLEQLYDEMMPMCSDLISVGRGIAGFAAIFYIGSRVWRHIANAEPVDFYPLFRPFVLGFAIAIFPSLISLINGVLSPTVAATADMVKGSDKAIALLLKEKAEKVKTSGDWKMYVGESGEGNRDLWYQYTYDQDPADEGLLESIGNSIRFSSAKIAYGFQNAARRWMSEVLQILYEAAALCIDTLRTFQLIVMAILGPLAFGIAVFDGFQHTLTSWLARYLNIYLWLPVANIFGAIIGKVQEHMIKLDISQIDTSGDTFFSSADVAYLVFLVIGIVGYLTVPSVANSIVNAGGEGGLLRKVTNMTSSTAGSVVSRTGATGDALYNSRSHFNQGYNGTADPQGIAGAIGQKIGQAGGYMADKLSGGSKS